MTLAWETQTTKCGCDIYWYVLCILLRGPITFCITTVNPAYLFQEDFNTNSSENDPLERNAVSVSILTSDWVLESSPLVLMISGKREKGWAFRRSGHSLACNVSVSRPPLGWHSNISLWLPFNTCLFAVSPWRQVNNCINFLILVWECLY